MQADEFNPYRRFLGLFVPYAVAECRELTPGAKLCYGRLMTYAGANGVAWPSLRSLSEALGVSERMVQKYLKELREQGFIRCYDQRHKHQSSYYTFLRHPVLSPDREPMRFSEEGETLYEDHDPEYGTEGARPAKGPTNYSSRGAHELKDVRPTNSSSPGLTNYSSQRQLEIQKEELSEETQRGSRRRSPSTSRKREGAPAPKWMDDPNKKKEALRETSLSQDEEDAEADAVAAAQERSAEERRRLAREAEANVQRFREQAQAAAAPRKAQSAPKRQGVTYKPWAAMSEAEQIALVLAEAPQHEATVRALEKLWLEEFAAAFPDLPPSTNQRWEAHHFRDALFLLQRYSGDEVTVTLRYVLREWASIRERIFKGDAEQPVLRMVGKLHARFVREALAWEKWAPVLQEYRAWREENPGDPFPPSDLKARYDAAKKELAWMDARQ